jgi:hypothetical protein
MRTASGLRDSGDGDDDGTSTVRAFFEETVDILEGNVRERDDRDSIFSATSSGSTQRPIRTRSPTVVTNRQIRDHNHDLSDDEPECGIHISDDEEEEAIEQLLLSGVEEEVEDDGPEEGEITEAGSTNGNACFSFALGPIC